MEGLTEGRIVHYVLDTGEHRPAIVVRVWSKETGVSNLQVFMDGDGSGYNDKADNIEWKTSIEFSSEPEPNTWHWIERA